MMTRPFIALISWLGLAGSAALAGDQIPAASCAHEIAAAERIYQIPPGLLHAMGINESGLNPLAINADGSPYFPATLQEAVALVRSLQRRGAKYIDIGCMQIDLRHHPDAFPSLEVAFTPAENSIYGAWYLATLARSTGSWVKAVGRYHSGEPESQRSYITSVLATYSGVPVPKRVPGRHSNTQKSVNGPVVASGERQVKLSFMTVTRPVATNEDAR